MTFDIQNSYELGHEYIEHSLYTEVSIFQLPVLGADDVNLHYLE